MKSKLESLLQNIDDLIKEVRTKDKKIKQLELNLINQAVEVTSVKAWANYDEEAH